MEIQDIDEAGDCWSDPILTVAVAVNGSKNSKNAVKWALENFTPEGRVSFRILHVRPKITRVPSPSKSLIFTILHLFFYSFPFSVDYCKMIYIVLSIFNTSRILHLLYMFQLVIFQFRR